MYRGLCLTRSLVSRSALTSQRKTTAGIIVIQSKRTIFGLNLFKKNSTSVDLPPVKDEYEIEFEKFKKQDTSPHTGWIIDGDPILDDVYTKITYSIFVSFVCVCLPILYWFTPVGTGDTSEWYVREARKLVEERREREEPLMDVNFAPKELIESMVPPAGDWEREWLSKQSSVFPDPSKTIVKRGIQNPVSHHLSHIGFK